MNKFFKVIIITLILMNITTLKAFADGTFSNLREMEEDIYKHLQNRDITFSYIYIGTREEFQNNINKIIKNAYSKDDYLERSWLEIKPKAEITSTGIETTINVTYLTTKEQEEYVDRELKSATFSIINKQMSDLDKVTAINDYIINRYEYDYTIKSTSAYSALTTSVTVCQGYAMTAYKMLNYAAIDNRIVVGTCNEIPHSWNIVKIDGKWYQLDITNNDSINKDKYFLVNDKFLEKNKYIWDKVSYPEAPIEYHN